MGFDPPKPSVAVSGVPKARHKQPLQSQLPTVCVVPRGGSSRLEFPTATDEGGHDTAEQTMPLEARGKTESRNAQGHDRPRWDFTQTPTHCTLTEPLFGFVRVERHQRAVTVTLATRAPKGLG